MMGACWGLWFQLPCRQANRDEGRWSGDACCVLGFENVLVSCHYIPQM